MRERGGERGRKRMRDGDGERKGERYGERGKDRERERVRECLRKEKIVIVASLSHTVPKIAFMYFQKRNLCIPRKGIARPQSQFLHSCVCERYVYSQDRSTYLAAAK